MSAIAWSVKQFRVFPGIESHGLTLFPVVDDSPVKTDAFLTLQEALQAKLVEIAELTNASGPRFASGPRVNQLGIINNSDRPVILIAGEIVIGGMQDRVVGKDLILAPHAGPVPLNVFCVEHGRWHRTSNSFCSADSLMAEPSIRVSAMADKNQAKVWDEVERSQRVMADRFMAKGFALDCFDTTSYGKTMAHDDVQKEIRETFDPATVRQQFMTAVIGLGACGLIAGVSGRCTWLELFANDRLLDQYLPRLLQSFMVDALRHGNASTAAPVPLERAESFLADMSVEKETVQRENEVYEYHEGISARYRTFVLSSLLPGQECEVHRVKVS